jgi:cyclophilin family peptidyl-prolyl cis-trans isomerase
MIDPNHRPLSFRDYVYWGIFIFVAVFVGQLLVSLIEMSSREETRFLSTNALDQQIAVTMMTLKTTQGEISIRLFRQQAPVSVNNIVQLAQSGFYDGTKFHHVVPGERVEGGDPLSREKNRDLWGTGGPGFVFEDENVDMPLTRGVVGLSNRGSPGTNGSQFFIVTAEELPELEGRYSVIGRVTKGMDVVDRIASGALDDKGRPVQPVVVREARIGQ